MLESSSLIEHRGPSSNSEGLSEEWGKVFNELQAYNIAHIKQCNINGSYIIGLGVKITCYQQ